MVGALAGVKYWRCGEKTCSAFTSRFFFDDSFMKKHSSGNEIVASGSRTPFSGIFPTCLLRKTQSGWRHHLGCLDPEAIADRPRLLPREGAMAGSRPARYSGVLRCNRCGRSAPSNPFNGNG